MERTATLPVLLMVTRTIGMGQYGGGVDGNFAVDGLICKLAVVAVLGAALVGGLVAGGVVGPVGGGTERIVLCGVVTDGTVVATLTLVVGTGLTFVVARYGRVVVVSDSRAVVSAGCCAGVGETTTRGVS